MTSTTATGRTTEDILEGMVLVPAGPFTMGDDAYPRETPRRTEDLPAFWIDRYQVTNEQWRAYVADGGHLPAYWVDGAPPAGLADHPVMVSWDHATAYAAWRGKRLPTETEWEKAARGTDGRRFPWGEDWDESRAYTWETGAVTGVMTVPVTALPGSASPYGCEQMVGNTEEWVSDHYDAYPGSAYRSRSYGTTFRVLRGGAWIFGQTHARCSYRCFESPDLDDAGFVELGGPGFRCASDELPGGER